MSRIYSISVGGLNHNSARDLFEIFAGNIALRLRQFGVNSYNAVSPTNLDLGFNRFVSGFTAGSGGFSVVPVPLRSTDPAASFTATASDTTQMSGTSVVLLEYGANADTGWIYTPSEDLCPIIQAGEAFSIGGSTGSGSVDISFFAIIEELS